MQFQRGPKTGARLAIDVRRFAQVVWEIGLHDAGAGGPHVLFFAPRDLQEPLFVTLRGQRRGRTDRKYNLTAELRIRANWQVAKSPLVWGQPKPKAVRARSSGA
jgi:hypothetical protein